LFSGQSIVSMIAQRIPPTISLMILTLLISVSIAVPLGVVAVARQGSWTDRVVGGFKWSSGEQPTRLSRASG
jgi:peptide/nickel transport system permease protein